MDSHAPFSSAGGGPVSGSETPGAPTPLESHHKRGKRALVIGAGVSGLSTALHLQDSGWSVQVLERAPDIGGVIRSERLPEGFLSEAGPSEMLLRSEAVLSILRRIGLDASLQEANAHARKRFITRNGQLHPVPLGPFSLMTTGLWSLRGRLRVLREPWIPPAPDAGEESVATFVRRRLGDELFDYAIDPLVSGIFAGDPQRLAIRHAFPRLHRLEQEHGSLVRGAIAQARARRRSGEPRFRSRLISFKEGMQELPRAFARALDEPPATSAELRALEPIPHGWSARWEEGEAVHHGRFDAVVCAVPAHRIFDLPIPEPLKHEARTLREIPYAPVATVLTGHPRSGVAHPLDGFGVLHPARENRATLGTLFISTLFPGRAPAGKVSLLTFVGGRRAPDRIECPDAALLEAVARDHRALLGASASPEFHRIVRWPQAIPQYECGYQRFHGCMEQIERDFPGFFFAGSYRQGPGIGDCLLAGRDRAARIAGRA